MRDGLDAKDEVWEGTYVVMRDPTPEHQLIVGRLQTIFTTLVDFRDLGTTYPGGNVSDRAEDWRENYRCPDVLVFLKDNTAVQHAAHWEGGPDLLVEVVSPGDRSREKLDFYADLGVREFLVIDRGPWRLELYEPTRDRVGPVAVAVPGERGFETTVVPAAWSLTSQNGDRPKVRVEGGGQVWSF